MINKEEFDKTLIKYKDYFENYRSVKGETYWQQEDFKWSAAETFQKHWDIEAEDFEGMLEKALEDTSVLLKSQGYFAAGMIEMFAKAEPETVRGMFRDLYDESKDIVERIFAFKDKAQKLLVRIGMGDKKHYQEERAISVYLFLRYPEKYFLYRFKQADNMNRVLKGDYKFSKGHYEENIRAWLGLYNEVAAALRVKSDAVEMVKSRHEQKHYPDAACHVFASDFAYFITNRLLKDEADEDGWEPEDYNTGIDANRWAALMSDPAVYTDAAKSLIEGLVKCKGQATCTELAKKCGGTPQTYITSAVEFARRVVAKTNCPLSEREDETTRLWAVLFLGKKASKKDNGTYIWKLRDELAEAYEMVKNNSNPKNYWLMVAKPTIWKASTFPVGAVKDVPIYTASGNKRHIYQNFVDAKPGDKVILYESTPSLKVVGLGEIDRPSDNVNLYLRKTENFEEPVSYADLKDAEELKDMEFFKTPHGTFYKVTPSEYDYILDLVREDNPEPVVVVSNKYDKADFLKEVFMTEKKYDTICAILKRKKNIILQGAPGVGKTFTAKRLAYSIMGEKDDKRIQFVQFHQNYSYEDFVEGYKPKEDENGFRLEPGLFKAFCETAEYEPDKPYFLIIDEINRGNLSKIFGELLMLIEAGYRGQKLKLAYSKQEFSVPENLYIIGMMNTADRSLAMIDYALRRRFSFIDMEPGFDTDGFKARAKAYNNPVFDELIEVIGGTDGLNAAIAGDPTLGNGFCIGHSYFVLGDGETCTDELLRDIVNYDILPMLQEYWFDDAKKYQEWADKLHKAVNDGIE